MSEITYREAFKKDIPQLIELMNAQYARKKDESYFLLMFLNYFTVRYLLHESVLHLKMYLSKITITFLFFILLYGMTTFVKEPFALSIKAIAIVVWGYIVFIRK